MKFKFICLALSFIILNNCGSNNDIQTKKASLRQEWFPNSNYAGALFAVNDFAKPNKLELELVAGSDDIDPVKMILSGQNTFADAGADVILAAIDKGADLVVIGVVNLNSPTCFIAKQEKEIRTPKDFEGKRVGILTGTSTELIYRTLVKKSKLDKTKIDEVEVSFDLTTFIADFYDVRPAFIYDEPVSLDMKGIEYSIIEPKHYGVNFLGTVYFTTGKVIEENPELVQAFVNSVADGWRAALKYPERAIKYLKQYDRSVDEQRELKSLKKGEDYFKGKDGKILWADQEDWEKMVKSLSDLGIIKKVDLKKSINNSFLVHYYENL